MHVRADLPGVIGCACFVCPPACVATSSGRRRTPWLQRLRPTGFGGGNPFAEGLNYFSPRGIVQWLSYVDSLQPHGLQHARLLCPPPFPRIYSNSCPLMLSNHLILCHPLLLWPSIFPSIRVFSNELALRIR